MMPGEETSHADMDSLRRKLRSVRDSITKLEGEERALQRSILPMQVGPPEREPEETADIQSDERAEDATSADKGGPRVVPPREREQEAGWLAGSFTDALEQYLLNAEGRVRDHADKTCASLRNDLERQRSNIESLVGLFAQRLRHQEEGLFLLQKMVEDTIGRLDRQADLIRSMNEREVRRTDALMEVLRLLRASAAPSIPPLRLDNEP